MLKIKSDLTKISEIKGTTTFRRLGTEKAGPFNRYHLDFKGVVLSKLTSLKSEPLVSALN